MIGKEYDVTFLTLSLYLSFIRENQGASHCRAHPQSAFLVYPDSEHHHSARCSTKRNLPDRCQLSKPSG